MIVRKLGLTVVAAGLLAAATSFAQSTSTTNTRSYTFLPFGLAATETAQVNVVNLAANSSSGTAASCTGTISFLSNTGATLGTATSFTVTSGQTFSATRAGSGSRAVLRAVITLTIPTSSAPPCVLASSLETYDTSTGVTHLHESGEGMDGGGHFGR